LPPRLTGRESPPSTFLFPAFRATQPFDDFVYSRIPSAKACERVWIGPPLVTAFALQHQDVLSKLVTQFLDVQVTRHFPIVAAGAEFRPSSIAQPLLLYKSQS
jgi:hypothetical protein